MKRKIDLAVDHIDNLENVLCCPLCQNILKRDEYSLKCLNNHTFNINKKGITSFSEPINDKLYDKEMFMARRVILESTIYKPVFDTLKSLIKEGSLIVDAGSGEGTYLNMVYKPSNRHIGIDLAKEGLNIASSYSNVLWLLADLANIPIIDQSVDVILNILSPANYEQFDRILKDDGILIKVIVNENYLKELREQITKKSHDHERVLSLLEQNFDIISKDIVKYTTQVDKNLVEPLFKMTPLTKHHEKRHDIDEITIDLTIVVAKKKVKL